MRIASRLGPCAVVVLAAACGPIRATSRVTEAQAELDAARAVEAPRAAPYEFVAAEAYLHKAREEQSRADFEVAERLATVSRDCARAARALSERATRKAILGGPAASDPAGDPVCRPGPFHAPPPRGAPNPQPTPNSPPAAAPEPAPAPKASPPPSPAPLPEGESP